MIRDNCLLHDGSVFIGFSSLPFGKQREFFENEIKQLFENYKDALEKNLDRRRKLDEESNRLDPGFYKYADEFSDYFYVPKAYYVFGHFDLAVLSLVEDFVFSTRTFTPFDPVIVKDNPGTVNASGNYDWLFAFDHKVFTGPTPKFQDQHDIVDLAKKTFLNRKSLPLISITQLKLSNALQISYGSTFLRSVIKAIYFILRHKRDQWKGGFDFLLLESYAWHEITLITFADSYDKIFEIMPLLRRVNFESMCSILNCYEALEGSLLKRSPIFSQILGNSRKSQINKLYPVIINSSTSLGFDFDLLLIDTAAREEALNRINMDREDKVIPLSRWRLQPGSIDDPLREFLVDEQKSLQISMGTGDFYYPFADIVDGISSKEFIDKFSNLLEATRKADVSSIYTVMTMQQKRHQLGAESFVETNYEAFRQVNKGLDYSEVDFLDRLSNLNSALIKSKDDEAEFDQDVKKYREKIKRLEISISDVKFIHTALKSLCIPKIVYESMLNMIAMYNQGISDPILYSKFIELRPFVNLVIETVKEAMKNGTEGSSSGTQLSNRLYRMLQSFEYAYSNRFHASLPTEEITDHNLYFKGGIQQLVSAYDGFSKSMAEQFGNHANFVYVEGNPQISTVRWALRLNYFHIFQPESLLTAAVHEIAYYLLFDSYDQAIRDGEDFEIGKFTSLNPKYKHEINIGIKKIVGNSEPKFDQYKYFLRQIRSPQFFDHIFSDIVTYYFTFLRNKELFKFWYWGNFASTSACYHSPVQLKKNCFIHYLLRLLCVEKFCLEQDNDEWSLEQAEVPYSPLLREMSRKYMRETNDFLDTFFSTGLYRRWIASIIEFVEQKFRTSYGKQGQISEIILLIKDRAQKYGNDLHNGISLSSYIREDKSSAFKYSQALVYSYLMLLKEESGYSEGKNLVLTRTKDGKHHHQAEDARLMFDPLGGIYIDNYQTRRDYFKYRCALTMSFWDMSLKEKGYYLRNAVED